MYREHISMILMMRVEGAYQLYQGHDKTQRVLAPHVLPGDEFMELARWIPALLGVQPNPKSGACNSTGLASLRSHHYQAIYTPPLISSFDECYF